MQLTLHLTKACNLRCTYCYFDDFSNVRLDPALALAAVDQVLARKPTHLGITFFGGEPLLCKDAIRTLVPAIDARCARADVPINFKIPTNGTLLDEEFVDFCERHAVFVSLSIDGGAAAQAGRVDACGRPSFARARHALTLLAKRATSFATYSVITPKNARFLAESIEFLYTAGSRILITAPDFGAPWTPAALRALGRQYGKLARFYIRETRARSHFYLSAFDGKIQAHVNPAMTAVDACRPGVQQLSVAPDGTYYPCIQFIERSEFAMGHVLSGIAPFRANRCALHSTPDDDTCAPCAIRQRCSSQCVCVALQSTGRVDRVPPVVCEHERLLTRIVDRTARTLYRQRTPLFVTKQYNPDYDRLRTIEALVLQHVEARPDAHLRA